MEAKDISRWIVIENETDIPDRCWVTVQTEDNGRTTILNTQSSKEFRSRCAEQHIVPIAYMYANAPEPYELDTYQMAYLYPTEYELKAWENECRLAESLGRPAPEKPKEKICVIIPTECNSVFGRPYTTVYCDGQVLKTPTHNVKPIGENQ